MELFFFFFCFMICQSKICPENWEIFTMRYWALKILIVWGFYLLVLLLFKLFSICTGRSRWYKVIRVSLQLLKSAHVLTHNKFWIRRHQPAAVSKTKEIFSFHFISLIKYNYNLTGIANTAPSSCIQIYIIYINQPVKLIGPHKRDIY